MPMTALTWHNTPDPLPRWRERLGLHVYQPHLGYRLGRGHRPRSGAIVLDTDGSLRTTRSRRTLPLHLRPQRTSGNDRYRPEHALLA
jgi:hypothetical protein